MGPPHIRRSGAAAIAVMLGFMFGEVPADEPAADPRGPGASTQGQAPNGGTSPELTAADLETFFDGLLPYALRNADIAGGVVSVVKDGNLLFAKGYGYSNLETRAPVSPKETLFRPASISKLFTWTAVMQLVEQGRIDLDRDVNEYLDFDIVEGFGKPITMRHLLTHTPGFEDVRQAMFAPSLAQLPSLETYVKQHQPKRIFPPGEIVAYSNYGSALAGYIVQRLSGEPFTEYIANHILQPLGMTHSTFSQPLPPDLARLMSKGYKSASDGEPRDYELLQTPAGSLASTATDMARFMLAHLQGDPSMPRLLRPETFALMHSPQHRVAPGRNGFALGFYAEDRNGHRIIGHGGDTRCFHSDLHLILDAGVGLFISVNSGGGDYADSSTLRTAVFRAFLDRYFPFEPPEEATIDAAPSNDVRRVVGWYMTSRRGDRVLRIARAFNQTEVTARADGTIEVSRLRDFSDTPKRWRQVAPLVFREIGGQAHLTFVADGEGQIAHWISDDFIPVMLFQRVEGLRAQGLLVLFAPLSLAIMLGGLIVWGIGHLIRRHYGKTLQLSPVQRRARRLSRVGAALILVMVAGWTMYLAVMPSNDDLMMTDAGAPWMYLLYCVGMAALLGSAAIIINAAVVWRYPRNGVVSRIGEALLALAAVYMMWFIFAYRLVSFDTTF